MESVNVNHFRLLNSGNIPSNPSIFLQLPIFNISKVSLTKVRADTSNFDLELNISSSFRFLRLLKNERFEGSLGLNKAISSSFPQKPKISSKKNWCLL